MSIDTMDCETWIDSTLIDRDDRKVGTIEAIYFDEDSGQPQWWLSPWLERLDGVSPAPVDAGEQQIDVEVVLPQPAVLTTS